MAAAGISLLADKEQHNVHLAGLHADYLCVYTKGLGLIFKR